MKPHHELSTLYLHYNLQFFLIISVDIACVAVLHLVHVILKIFWGIPVLGEHLLLSNTLIFILIWILFTIAVQPVYVLLMQILLTQHVVLMLIDVKGKYCYMWPALHYSRSGYTCILIFQFFTITVEVACVALLLFVQELVTHVLGKKCFLNFYTRQVVY